MAGDAAARLYDVDEDSVEFKKLDKTERYDQGTFSFRARRGRLIDLDKLHESIWATRLSGGTRSGLVSLEVTAVGYVSTDQDKTVLRVDSSEAEFILAPTADSEQDQQQAEQEQFASLQKVSGKRLVKVTGIIDDYNGQWPGLLAKKPKKPRRILVSSFEILHRANNKDTMEESQQTSGPVTNVSAALLGLVATVPN